MNFREVVESEQSLEELRNLANYAIDKYDAAWEHICIYGARPFVCKNDGSIYIMISDAAKEYNLDPGNISKVLTNKLLKTGGMHFKYIDDIEEMFEDE